MLRRRSLFAATLAAPALLSWRAARAQEPVDVELVLAVDVSRSVDAEEQELQFRGYEAAFRDPRLIEGIAGGPVGAIACTLFTWSDWHIQTTLLPWTRLDGPRAAQGFADALAAAPRQTHLYTSISGAMDYAAKQFGQSFEGTRRVVDISGDGVNNSGRPVAEARAAALDQGIVLNGLAVLDKQPSPPGPGRRHPAARHVLPGGGDRRSRQLPGGGRGLHRLRSRGAPQDHPRNRHGPAAGPAPGGAGLHLTGAAQPAP